ncbi:heat shock transcription factor, X-linked member 3-like [Muntiacus reevesi]|uniref:heat shock transcription factor, X-linked member 3-like n=1 Tax=Muntiacus reevesi TaxID=9886 RepID=UPI00330739DD
MASQSSHEAQAALLAPSTDGEPSAGDPRDSSPDPNVDSGEALEKQGDQPESPDPGLHDNLPPQGLNPEMANENEINASFGLSFPRKLWRIMEDATFTSVHWNDKGDMVVIEADLFQMEVLQRRGVDQICETDSIKSFIRELNLYGFRKIRSSGRSERRKKLMIYRNSNFQRDKPLLLQNIQRKGNPRTTSQPATGTTETPKRKKRVMASRHSPRLHHNEFTQEVGNKVQKGMPTACRTPSQCSFVFSDLWSMGSVASQAGGNHLPSEQGGPSGESPSNSATSVSPATVGRDSPGELPESPPVYPDSESVMTLYNTCYSSLMAGLLFMAPDEAPESEEEQGDSSDHKCTLCEQAKKKPNP